MTTKKAPGAVFALCLLPLFFSCSARIDGVVREGGAAELKLQTSLEPRTSALIRSFQGFMGEATNAPVLDGPAISRSMAAAPGVRSVSLVNTGPEAMDGGISISNIGDFLASGVAINGAGTRFITFTEGRDTSSIVISLDMNSAPEIIARLSPDVEDYLMALMAPVVLGEPSSRLEYIALVSSVYGRPLANEISEAKIRASIEFPRPIKTIRGGTAAGRQAEFEVPLLDILVLEQPLRYEVSW
ncbi:MAG: hypothetical protein LBQ94_09710 [Treponema sp.]|nr:hypothetical protein [Treponema sp.]